MREMRSRQKIVFIAAKEIADYLEKASLEGRR